MAVRKRVTQVTAMEPVILRGAKGLIPKAVLYFAPHDVVAFIVLPIWVPRFKSFCGRFPVQSLGPALRWELVITPLRKSRLGLELQARRGYS